MTEPSANRYAAVGCPFCSTLNRVNLARLADGPRCASCHRPLLLDRPQPVPGDALDRVLGGTDVPVLVDFYADWCGPCKVMAPVLDEIAYQRKGEVLVGKLDTDRWPEVTTRFQVRGIPTLILFSGGKEVSRLVGAVSRREVESVLEKAMARLP